MICELLVGYRSPLAVRAEDRPAEGEQYSVRLWAKQRIHVLIPIARNKAGPLMLRGGHYIAYDKPIIAGRTKGRPQCPEFRKCAQWIVVGATLEE